MKEIKGLKTVKKAMKTIYKWAKRNGIDYFSFGTYLEEGDRYLHLTYTLPNTPRYNEGGNINYDYFKEVKADLLKEKEE